MLSAQPTPQSEGSQSRKKALSKLFKEIHSAISTYIHLKELTKETGWKVEASSFLQEIDQIERYKTSFLALYFKTTEFAQSLRTVTNILFSWMPVVKMGSTLKEQIEDILQKYNPFSVVYIVEECRDSMKYPQAALMVSYHVPVDASIEGLTAPPNMFFSVQLNDFKCLSAESKTAILFALKNENTLSAMREEARKIGFEEDFSALVKSCKDNYRFT